ncbi:MAG: recombinase family protein [Cetobacterium sp.]|nr:recombinase family protein [Cetobacterium sp.]
MRKTYGYCRISTKSQSIERQIRNIIREYPDADIVEEICTGTSLHRTNWIKLKNKLKKGDIVVFDSVSRMSRNSVEGIKEYFELMDKGIDLIFLKEQYINTGTYKRAVERELEKTGNKIADLYINATNEVFRILAEEQIKIAFDQSEKEVMDLRQRTKEGIETARLNGKQIGGQLGKSFKTKKSIEAKEIILKHSKRFGGSLNNEECWKLAGISENSFYKYVKELELENK